MSIIEQAIEVIASACPNARPRVQETPCGLRVRIGSSLESFAFERDGKIRLSTGVPLCWRERLRRALDTAGIYGGFRNTKYVRRQDP